MRRRCWTLSLALVGLTVHLLGGCTSEADRLYRRAKDAAQEEGDYENAIRFVDDAIRLDPGEGRYYRRRGDWLRDLGRHDEAIQSYDSAVTADRPVLSAHLKAIDLCLDLGRLDEAAARIEVAATQLRDPDDLETLEEHRARLQILRSAAAASPSPETTAVAASPASP